MLNLERLKNNQPVVYTILNNSLVNNKLAHAYMLSGIKGSLQTETAYLLAQSLVCTKGMWACEVCDDCLRVKNNTYSDVIIIDGSKSIIKKEDVLELQSQFSMTAFEKSSAKIFIVKDAHNMTVSAANSLLKFLEEPSNDVLGILISDEVTSILPTIMSRCTELEFKQLAGDSALSLMNDLDISAREAHYFSQVVSKYLDSDEFLEAEAYLLFKDVFSKFIKTLSYDPDKSSYVLQNILLKNKDKEVVDMALNMFLDMLIVFFNDIIIGREVDELYTNMCDKFRDNYNYLELLTEVLAIKAKLVNNVNVPLLMDQLMFNFRRVM